MKRRETGQRRRTPHRIRVCGEPLEQRRLLASAAAASELLRPAALSDGPSSAALSGTTYDIDELQSRSITGTTGTKPQSKVWSHDGYWWSVLASGTNTWLWRLDGETWHTVLNLLAGEYRGDVRSVGDVAHVLLENGTASKLASVEYVPGSNGAPGTYQFWSVRPSLVDVTLSSGISSATLDLDTTGRMWVASDATSSIELRYSDSPYATFSAPIAIATNVASDDTPAVVAMPGAKIGVLWPNQQTKRWGFRMHNDADPPGVWSPDEVPASQSAQNIGGGMSDDHLNLKVTSDGTLYAAVKTSYDTAGETLIALLVRHPNGTWDDMYRVDTVGSRPTLALSESHASLLVIYVTSAVVYRESALSPISFGPVQTLLSSGNNPSGTKETFDDEVVIIASGRTALITALGPPNQAPTAMGESYGTLEDTTLNVLVAQGVLQNDTDPDNDALSAVRVAGPTHGSLALASNGSFSYAPDANYHGSDSFTYRANDGAANSNIVTVSIDVTSVEDPPTAVGDFYHAPKGQTRTVVAPGVLANDLNPENATLTAVLRTAPLSGTLDLLPDGSFSYTPGPSYLVSDSFTYVANDGVTDSNEVTVMLFENDAPVLDNSGAMTFGSIQATDANPAGMLVVDLIASAGGNRITDADASAVEGIAVIGSNTAGGTWQYSLDNGAQWSDLGTPSVAIARLLAADATTRIRLLPNPAFSGTLAAGITLRAWDQTSGTSGGTGDTTQNGLNSAFSTATETASITVTGSTETYLLSLNGNGSLVSTGGAKLAMTDADVVKLTIQSSGAYQYAMFFDGSDVGLTVSSEDVDAFDVQPDGSIVLSTLGAYSVSTSYVASSTGSGPLIAGAGEDLLRFVPTSVGDTTSGTWSLYFDGSDVGLSGSAENVDAVSVQADGKILLSVFDKASVANGGATVAAQDEDLLEFTPTSLGATTAGTWRILFDCTDVGLGDSSAEDVDALFVEPAGAPGALPTFFFSTYGAFSVAGAAGADEDVFKFQPTALGDATSGAFGPGLLLDGSLYGLSSFDIDGVHHGPIPSAPPPAPAAVPKLAGLALADAATALGKTQAPPLLDALADSIARRARSRK